MEADFGDFDRRLREHEHAVYSVAYSVLGNTADAEDVTQDVFLKAYTRLETLRAPEKFRPWVTRMSRRLALNRLRDGNRSARRNARWYEQRATPVDVEDIVADRDFCARLHREIDRLPEKLRSVVVLCGIERLPARAVATSLGIPEATVRSRLHLARKHLLRILAAGGIAILLSLYPAPTSISGSLAAWHSPTAALLQPLSLKRTHETGGKRAD